VKNNAATWTFAGAALLVVFVAANVAVNESNLGRLRQESDAVAHAYDVSAALAAALSDMLDAETGQRGYLITEDDAYLAPYRAALARVEPDLEAVTRLTRDNPAQQADLAQLSEHARAKLVELDATIQLARDRGYGAARAAVLSHLGRSEMDQLRVIARSMSARENALLAVRRGEAERAYREARVSAVAGGILACLLVGAYLVLLRGSQQAQERAAADLAAQRELLQTTLASIGDGVVTTDPRARVTFLNPVAEALTGWKLAEAHGRPLEEVFHIVNLETRATAPNPAARALSEGVIVGLANHTLLVSRDGSERPIDDSAAPIRLGERIAGCVLVFRDITERSRMEAELADADRRKDEFLATLAHELRNPLAPLVNSLELMKNPDLAPEMQRRARDMIGRQVSQMVRLIDDLMDAGRIRAGKIVLARRRAALAEVLEQAIETARPAIDAAKHHLQVELPAAPVWLDADPLRLAQVFANLLSNSAKFTPPGGHIGLAARVEGGRAIVRVSDDGMGIAPADLERIFGLFTQVDSTIERERGGLGIGLSLVRVLSQLHGGTVSAASEGPGRGAQFTVTLPVLPE